MNNKKEINLINIQIYASIIFIITIFINIFLSLNEKQKLLKNKPYISEKQRKLITRLNRIIILCILIVYLYASYNQKTIDKSKGKDTKADNIELLVSIISLIGGLLILYEVFTYDNNEIDIESPNI